ncbi:MAG TPA: PAS domain-containing sensor histidine kinase [Alphaproteobacteria bacterium]|nr:PAS domain-containing sensor histidine kinase [Alphaproteobacteria bacterium]HOO51433.1 PAS domain-containing sensor histidine kinase [Alphaproteobacteria bacterium]
MTKTASPQGFFGSMRVPVRLLWLRSRLRSSWDGRLALLFIFLAILAGVATYAALKSAPPFGDSPDAVIWLLNLDLIILCVLGILIARRVVSLFTTWRRGIPGARLHLRLVYIFGLLAMAPAVIMTIFSLFFFHYGVQTWFSDRVRTAVNESQEVAESYLREHRQVIRADILAMAKDLDHEADLVYSNPAGFSRFVETQSVLRGLSEAVIFNKSKVISFKVGDISEFLEQDIPAYVMESADDGDVVILTAADDDRVQALVRLSGFAEDLYLFVGRSVESNVLKHLETSRAAVRKYDEMADRYIGLRRTVTMIYIVVALILLFSAVFFALAFARRLATPITSLIEASDRVRKGDLTAMVSDNSGFEEFDHLARSFNRMTRQIMDQRCELIQANQRIDERRQFTETILAGVTSGVLSLDKEGQVTLANASAAGILGRKSETLLSLNIRDLFPDLVEVISLAYSRPDKVHETEVSVQTLEKGRRTLLVRVGIELLGDKDVGAVITFDDITDVQSAQRKVAWADVARRIAHEIKNPLTPIQLSAERLKRKYLNQLGEDDQRIFSQCIDTIIRHVGDIGHMVSEFSAFARMPEPKFQDVSIGSVVSDCVLFSKQAHSGVHFSGTEFPICDDFIVRCDEQQIRQALINLIKNAEESLVEHRKKVEFEPEICVCLSSYGGESGADGSRVLIVVQDNGPGFPADTTPESLTEPYVTYKEKGTGLGLAIVKKIMEDHNGQLCFGVDDRVRSIPDWKDLRGACVVMDLPFADR